MGSALVNHRFLTDINPIIVEWIKLTGDTPQDNPEKSIGSNLVNVITGVVLPANADLGGQPARMSLEIVPGSQALLLHDLDDGQEALVILIGFGRRDFRDVFQREEDTNQSFAASGGEEEE